MRIIIDAFGGDKAPDEVILGAAAAVRELGVEVTLVGDEAILRGRIAALGAGGDGISIHHAPDVAGMEIDPAKVLREHPESSMVVGLRLLSEGKGDAFVSAGNTGALAVAATMVVKRMKGVKRAALATVLPTERGPVMLLDSGANLECRPEMLVGFGVMGSVYMQGILRIDRPRVGLVNVGTEETKGTDTLKAAHALLQKAPVHFVGNVESRDIPAGECDVAVADGLVGNVILKATEGLAHMFGAMLKDMFLRTPLTKVAALLLKSGMRDFKARLDYTEYGGAPLLGLRRPVIKAHGSSNAKAFKNAVRQAKLYCENHVGDEIERSLALVASSMAGEDEQDG